MNWYDLRCNQVLESPREVKNRQLEFSTQNRYQSPQVPQRYEQYDEISIDPYESQKQAQSRNQKAYTAMNSNRKEMKKGIVPRGEEGWCFFSPQTDPIQLAFQKKSEARIRSQERVIASYDELNVDINSERKKVMQ